MMAAVQLAVRSPCFPPMKCCCQIGRITDISNNSWRAIDRESNRRMAPCYLWVAATIFCLLNPQAKKSFSVSVVPGHGCSGISTRASGMIQLSTGPCETNGNGLQPDSPENRHQAIVHRRDDSRFFEIRMAGIVGIVSNRQRTRPAAVNGKRFPTSHLAHPGGRGGRWV